MQSVGSLLISGNADVDAYGALSAEGQLAVFGAALLVDANAAVGYLVGRVSVRPALAASSSRTRLALSGSVIVSSD
jgi:hypothetical protein